MVYKQFPFSLLEVNLFLIIYSGYPENWRDENIFLLLWTHSKRLHTSQLVRLTASGYLNKWPCHKVIFLLCFFAETNPRILFPFLCQNQPNEFFLQLRAEEVCCGSGIQGRAEASSAGGSIHRYSIKHVKSHRSPATGTVCVCVCVENYHKADERSSDDDKDLTVHITIPFSVM